MASTLQRCLSTSNVRTAAPALKKTEEEINLILSGDKPNPNAEKIPTLTAALCQCN